MSIFIKRTINERHGALAQALCEDRVTLQTRDELAKLVPGSIKVWGEATRKLRNDGRTLKLPYGLRESAKTYALDGLVVARTLGIPDEESSLPLQIFSLFYLAVHIIDDLAEDYPKFFSQFQILARHAPVEERTTKEVLPFSYTLNTIISIFKMFMAHGGYAKNGDRIFLELVTSLGAFTHFFLLEHAELPPEKIMQIKERGVSGIATSMIADLLCLENLFNYRAAVNIKQGLYYLGSLTQFTDDLRDYDVDCIRGNANLMAGLERKFKEAAPERFRQWYIAEEARMLQSFQNCGLTLNIDLLRAIPWYPSVVETK